MSRLSQTMSQSVSQTLYPSSSLSESVSRVSPLVVCAVCDSLSDDRQYQLSCRPTLNALTPFFPILESLSSSASPLVSCCRECAQLLVDQWDHYEAKQIPVKNRVYYLPNNKSSNKSDPIIPKKLSTVESSSALNAVKCHNSNSNSNHSNEEVLDLSLPSTSTATHSNSRHDYSEVKYWTPTRCPQVCYVCGEECVSLLNVLVRPIANCPYFPSLVSHPKPLNAAPIDASGKMGVCESCHRSLIQEWESFQRLNVPIADRHYNLRQCSSSATQQRITTRYFCTLCNNELTSNNSVQNVVISMLTVYDSSSSMKKLVLSSAQEFVFNSNASLESGRVLSCVNCFRDLVKGNDNQSNHSQQNDIKKKFVEFNKDYNNEQECCTLCNKNKTQLFMLNTNPPRVGHERKCYFPFLKDLLKPHEIDSFGRFKVCTACLASLESQWDAFELAKIPHNQRDYRLVVRQSPPLRQISPPPLKIQVSSPPPLQTSSSFIIEPLLTTVTTPTHNVYCTTQLTASSMQYSSDTETRISGPMDEFLSLLGVPLHVSANCHVCGEFSIIGHTYQLFSTPPESPILSHDLGLYPFFPFLKKLHQSDSDSRDKFTDVFLVCTFCYHSLIGQWFSYDSSPFIEDKDALRRAYNINDYICYICGITTYRKRVRSITVKDFPFLLEHPRPAGALTIYNGESVVTCLTCFESLTLQWRDYERMKVPIEMRKYNWIIVPPPRESSDNDAHHHVFTQQTTSSSGPIIFGLGSHHKPQPLLNVSSHTSAHSTISSKSPSAVHRSMATVSPLYQVSSLPSLPPLSAQQVCHNPLSNSALAATRTSSFAAALRKLAKQSIEPIIGGDNVQLCHSSQTNTTKNSMTPNASFQSAYQSPIVAPSPPVVSIAPMIAPIAAHQMERANDARKSEMNSYYERIHSDQSKESLLYAHSQRASPIVPVRPSPSSDHDSGQTSNGSHTQNASNRSGFQPYRTGYEEALRSNSCTALSGTSMPSHLLPYDALTFPYHPFIPPPHPIPPIASSASLTHHVPHPSASYRLEDHFYLDRFGLLRGSLHSGVGHPHANSANASSVPFNLARYSELLNSQHERILNDERHRFLNQSLSQSAYKSPVQSSDSPPRLNVSLNDRLIESNSDQYLINHVNHSTLNTPTKRDYNSASSGSILSGTPRDLISQSTHSNQARKTSDSSICATVKPLNLSSNSEHNNCEQVYLWRPQSDEDREHLSSMGAHNHSEHISDGVSRKNSLLEESLQSKALRLNNLETLNSLPANKCYDKVVTPIKYTQSDRSEGLPSRILDNSERSGANNSSLYWPPNPIGVQLPNNNNDKCFTVKSEIEECVVSKLDLDELKLKQKRRNRSSDTYSSSDEDDQDVSDDNEEEARNKLRYNIVLTKGLPLKLDASPEKISFLEMFSLTTHKRKSQMEFHKFLKRRKILRETSPVLFNDSYDCVDSCDDNKENPEILTSSNILPDSIASQERNLDVKLHFMSTLGLREQISCEKQRDIELLWEGILRERDIRIMKSRCWTKMLNNLNEDIIQKWLKNLQISYSSHSTFDSDLNHININGFFYNHPSISKYSNHNSSQRGQRKVILFNKHHNSDSTKTIFRNNQTHSRRLSKDFAQEFHDSVLFQTAKQQIAKHDHQSRPQEQHKHYADLSSSSYFKWPGIEAVMEAYQRYAYDQKEEKDFLQVRAQQLKNKMQDINREAEYLSQKMADLMQTKNQRDDERQLYQSALDSLKNCLKQLR